ncbi:MAG: hypothetical protein FJ098_13970, partial [Deltaproteobacteria bacterium]|nr:hypothetical protein [Deltaproteobacteria bacterium]
MKDNFVTEILPIIVWIAIIVLGRLFKKKKGPEETTPSPPRRRRPVADPVTREQRRRTPSGAVRAADRGAAAPGAIPGNGGLVAVGLQHLVEAVFRGTPWGATLGPEMQRLARGVSGPADLPDWADATSALSLSRLEDVAAALDDAARASTDTGPFNAATVEEFVRQSPRLSVTWARQVHADLLGLVLLGPSFASLRAAREGGLPDRDLVRVSVSGDAGNLRMPWSVRRPVLLAGISLLDLEVHWGGPSSWPEAAEEVVFDLGGLHRIPVPAGPLEEASKDLLQTLLRTRMPSLSEMTFDEARRRLPGAERGGARAAAVAALLSRGGAVPEVRREDLLPLLLELEERSPAQPWEARLLMAERRGHRPESRRTRGPAALGGRRAALLE